MPLPALPDGYLSADEVAADLGIEMQAMYARIRRNSGAAPPFERFGTGRKRRFGIRPEDYAAWQRARHRADAVELSQRLAEQARRRREQAVELEQAALDALREATAPDAAAS